MPERKIVSKWLGAHADNRQRVKKSTAHENRIAQAVGGRRLPSSGAKQASRWSGSGVTADGDIKTETFLIEHKSAEPQVGSIGVTRKWLKKVTEGAHRAMKVPVMVLTFEKAEMDGFSQDWLVLPLDIAQRLLGYEIKG